MRVFVVIIWLLTGCATGIEFDYAPESKRLPDLEGITFAVDVTDQRHYVTSGPQKPTYLGHTKDALGAVHDQDGKLSLAEQVATDLRRELQSLGLVENPTMPVTRIDVRIFDWNFDAGMRGRFWYDADVKVANSRGDPVAIVAVKDSKDMGGGFSDLARARIDEDIPGLYDEFLKRLVRENPEVQAAMKRAAGKAGR